MKTQNLLSFIDRLSADPKANIDIIVSQAVELLDCRCGFYHWLDENEGMLYIRGEYHIPKDCERCLKPEGCLCYETIINGDGKPAALENLSSTPFCETDPKIRKYGFQSYLGNPVLLNGKVCGSLDLFDVRRRKFSPRERNIAAALGKALSLEEERNCLQEAVKKKLAIEEMLFEISSKAISIGEINGFLDECVELMGRTLDVGGVAVWLHDAEANSLSNVSEWLAPGIPSYKHELQDIPTDVFPWGMELLGGGRNMNIEDIRSMPEGREKEVMQMMGIKSILMIPFFINDTFLGTLGICEAYGQPRKWHSEEVEILKTISQIISKSIKSYRVEKALEKANDELEENVKLRTAELQSTVDQLRKKHEELILREERLQELSQELLETNKAITVLARNVKKERKASEKKLALEISSRVIPLIEDIRKSRNLEERRLDLDMVTGYLHEISASMTQEQTSKPHLTHMEMRIASMISHGLTSSQIAARLHISPDTVKTHRKNIRKKLNIRNSGVEMRTHLSYLFGKENI